MDFLKGKRTVIINAVVVVFTALTFLFPDAEAPSEEQVGAAFDAADKAVIMVVAIVNLAMRAITSTPIWSKH